MARRVTIAVLAGLGALFLGCFCTGFALSYPAMRAVGPPPPGFESVQIGTREGIVVHGWLARGSPTHGAVLLLHGLRADRRSMLRRAEWLARTGRAVLLIDLPAHGETPGNRLTFGAKESRAVSASLDYIAASFPGEKIGVIGTSLGAASMVLAQPSAEPSAVVLESMYPTVDEAVEDRLAAYLGGWSRFLAPLLTSQIPLQLGIATSELRPIDHIASVHAAVLVAAGTRDTRTPIAETRRLFAAAREPKQLWEVAGAGHVDLYDFSPREYEATVLGFLEQHIQSPK